MRARAAVDVRSIVPRLVLELVLLVLVLVLVLLVGVGYMLTPAPALPAVLDIRRLPRSKRRQDGLRLLCTAGGWAWFVLLRDPQFDQRAEPPLPVRATASNVGAK